MIELRSASGSDVGRNPGRTNNEDRFLDRAGLWVVADGVGGHAGGEVAAGMAVDLMAREFRPEADQPLVDVIRQANRAIWEQARDHPELQGMATTVTAIAQVGAPDHPELIVANVGDSRTYLWRDGELTQLTVDHSQVEEMVRDGVISRQEAARHPYRHIVTRVLGLEPDIEVDTWLMNPSAGDRYLLCSDGLIDEVDEGSIAAVLGQFPDTGAAVEHLIQTALDNGGSDNVTVVLVDAVGSDTRDATVLGTPGPDSVAADGAVPVAGAVLVPPAVDAAPPPARRDVTGVLPAVGASGRRRRRMTFRVILFILAVLVVLGGAAASVVWYARDSYYVGLQGNQLTIFRGRPGGVLWFRPTVTQRLDVTTAQVLPSALPDLQSGMQESSMTAARQYVHNLVTAYQAANPSPTSTTTTTSPAVSSGSAGPAAATTTSSVP